MRIPGEGIKLASTRGDKAVDEMRQKKYFLDQGVHENF